MGLANIIVQQLKIDDLTLEAAKSSLAYATASTESNIGQAASASFVLQALKGLPKDQERQMLAKANVRHLISLLCLY